MKPVLDRQNGDGVDLVPFRLDFVSEAYLNWLKDDDTTRWLVKAGPDTGLAEVEDFCRQMIDSPDDCFFAIVRRHDQRHVGNVRLGPIDWANGNSRFGIMIGDHSARGQGFGTEVMSLVERLAFDTLGLRQLRFPVVAAHAGALRMYNKAGYTQDGPWPEDFVKDSRTFPMVTVSKQRSS